MGLMEQLQPGEEVLARASEFYATSRRVLRYQVNRGAETLWQLPYQQIRSVELERPPNHVYMAGGTLLALAGLFVTLTVGWVTPILAVPLGVGLIVLGGKGIGKPQYFQLYATVPLPKEEKVWRIPYLGSMDLVVAIQERINPRR